MMKPLDLLLKAKTDIELFVLLCHFFRNKRLGPITSQIALSGDVQHDTGSLQLMLKQSVETSHGKGSSFGTAVTHIFSLSQIGILSWQIGNNPPITGLKNIQTELRNW